MFVKIGDRVKTHDGEHEGTVISIRIYPDSVCVAFVQDDNTKFIAGKNNIQIIG